MSEKALRRLLRRKPLADLIARGALQHAVVTNGRGEVLAGSAVSKTGRPHEIAVNGTAIGHVWGDDAPRLASFLGALFELGLENRALAGESLDKYRELSMLYNVSEKLLAAPDIKDIGTLVCDEAQRFLRSDSVSVLLLNEEIGSLELVQWRGRPYHSRSSIEVGDDLVGGVLQSGTGEIVNDVSVDPRPIHADNALRSVISSPLTSKGRAIGVVVVGSESARHYNAADLQLLNALASQAAAAIEVARLYGALKRSSAKPADLIYGLDDSPPLGTLFALGAQHVFIAFILLVVPVLVALEAGLARSQAASVVSMSLIAMGIVTLLQVKRLGPVGAGYLAPQITSVIYLPPLMIAAQAGGIGLVFGMTALSGAFGLVLAQVIGRLRKLFPPEVCGVVVLMIGLSIIRVALPLFFGIEDGERTTDRDALAVGLVSLGTMVAATIVRTGHIRLYATIIGLLAGYAAAIALGVIDAGFFEEVRHLPWLGLPAAPSLELSLSPVLIVPFLIATIASNIKLVGLFTSAQKTNDVNWKRPDMGSIRGGIVADSIGNISSGLLGGVGTSTGAGNIGLAAATGATSRSIGVATGLMFIVLAFVPKVTGGIALMPGPVMGAGLLYTSCFLVISGVELIVSRLLDSRRTFIVGLSILAGIGLDLMPDAFADAPAWAASFLGSPLAFATTLAVSLNLLLGLGVSKKARLVLQPGAAPDDVLRSFERWGGMWGARPDVIRRAGPAAVELVEEVWSRDGPTEIAIDIVFDEFRLTVDICWTVDDRRLDGSELDRLVGHLQRRYDCRARLQADGRSRLMRFAFEH
ncbi:MAG TPA: solute carrier family 23 protein [Afifellaceae bacterium]|nr:solute carrier family 23 protein [Afifellaceae bacterium]